MPSNEGGKARFEYASRVRACVRWFLLGLNLFLVFGACVATGQTLYDYRVIAQTGNSLQGTGTIIDLGEGPSINDFGSIAFVAYDEPGIHGRVMVVADGNVEKNFQTPPTERIGRYVQINNQEQVAWWRRVEAPGSQLDLDTLVQRLDTGSSGVVIARGTYTDWFTSVWDYVLPWTALNNNGLVVFTGDLDPNSSSGGTVLASRDSGSGPYRMTPALNGFPTFYPVAADNDRVVIRAGDDPADTIKVFVEPALDPAQGVDAATSADFNAVGSKPGISDDGRVVVFMGDAKTQGPGIYMAAINSQNQSVSFKVVSLPPGSDLDYRVGVNHSQTSQLNDYLVAYMVADSAGSRALYTIRVDVSNPYSPQIAAPDLVVETGSPIQSLPSLGAVLDIQVNDPVNNHGQLVFWLQTGTSEAIVHAFCADADGDALCDSWETGGIRDVNDNVLLDLPAMGADPSVKDVFVEVDYMESPDGHTHRPSDVAMDFAVRAFFNSPVAAPPVACTAGDPTNCTGIRLHIDYGPASVMDPVAVDPVQGNVWGVLSGSSRLPHSVDFGTHGADPACNSQNEAAELREIKNSSTNGVPNFRPERLPAFHYVVFAHNRCSGNSGGPSGQRTLRDSVLTLGRLPDENAVGGIWDQAGTFMHELGHQLGLNHGGGPDDTVNWKPNYLSVMNYMFQKRGLTINSAHPEHPGAPYAGVYEGYFDYSRFEPGEIAILDETALDESTGLQTVPANPSLAGYGTYYYCDVGIETAVDDITQAIDWNCSNGPPETAVADDVNIGPDITKFTSGIGLQTLQSHNDWANLVYFGQTVGAEGLGDQALLEPVEEPEVDDPGQLNARYSVRVINPVRLVLPAGETGTYQFIVENTGSHADTYSLQAESSLAWAQVASIPSSVMLAPGASVAVPIDITLPALLNQNAADELTLIVRSQSNPLLADSATVITTVDSDDDGLTDADEAVLGTDPGLADTDGDGLDDGADPNPLVVDTTDGDLAPVGRPDGNLNAADMLIMLRIVTEQLTPGPVELLHGDLYPDGMLNIQDLLLQQQLVLQ